MTPPDVKRREMQHNQWLLLTHGQQKNHLHIHIYIHMMSQVIRASVCSSGIVNMTMATVCRPVS